MLNYPMPNYAELLHNINQILSDFEKEYSSRDIRERVIALIPATEKLRELGKSIIPEGIKLSARDRLLKYFLLYPRIVLNEKELSIVAGISEWARRVRELRVEHGWKIITGVTAKQMLIENEILDEEINIKNLGPNDYILLEIGQDRDSDYRCNIANDIRKGKEGSKEKILSYLKANINKHVTGEELSYVAQSSEWARRVRELRTEDGWSIVTKMSGNPSLPLGVYVLESDRQAPVHDRKITESVRREALRRDEYKCQKCHWTHELFNRSDPRFLELHHIKFHVNKGSNELQNLITYCNICHDKLHKLDKKT